MERVISEQCNIGAMPSRDGDGIYIVIEDVMADGETVQRIYMYPVTKANVQPLIEQLKAANGDQIITATNSDLPKGGQP